MEIYKYFINDEKSFDEKTMTAIATASKEVVDRDGDLIKVKGINLANWKKNPVIMLFHNYYDFPIGKAVGKKAWVEGDELKVKFQFLIEENPKAYQAAMLWKNGALKGLSIGFRANPKDVEWIDKPDNKGPMRIFHKIELLEISVVPIPANQEALAKDITDDDKIIIKEWMDEYKDILDEKGAIAYKKYPLAPEDTPWNGPKEVAKADVNDLKKMCAWVDPENNDKKSGYKLPHHHVDGYKTNWRGVRAAMGALLGARGGVDIPDKDRKAVYNHLAKHYKDFDKEAPEFKELDILDLYEELTELKNKYNELIKQLDNTNNDNINNNINNNKQLDNTDNDNVYDYISKLLDGWDTTDQSTGDDDELELAKLLEDE